MDEQQLKQTLAAWRYGVIAPLLHQQNQQTLQEQIQQLANQEWTLPQGQPRILKGDTIKKWYYRYVQGGLPALEDQARSDKGSTLIPELMIDGLFRIRKEHPRWTLAKVIKQIEEEGCWNGRKPSRSTLYAYASRHGLKRDPHKPQDVCRSFAYEQFGNLWMADFLHGPKIRYGRNRKKTYLHVILDDATRYVVHGYFYHSENVEVMIHSLQASIRRFGVPQKWYVDNGSAYSSLHLKTVCGRLGMQLIHTPPYKPRGRGKGERFFRTVRDQFLTDQVFRSLDQLNTAFQEWLHTYHEHPHSSLKMTPLQKRLMAGNVCRVLPPVADLDALFRKESRCRVYKDGTIRLRGKRFEVPGCIPGSRVQVFYLPWDMDHTFYGDQMAPARLLDPLANAKRFEHPKGGI